MTTCRVGGCGRERVGDVLRGDFCVAHEDGFRASSELRRARSVRCVTSREEAFSIIRRAAVDFARRIEGEDRVTALRARGAMAPAEKLTLAAMAGSGVVAKAKAEIVAAIDSAPEPWFSGALESPKRGR